MTKGNSREIETQDAKRVNEAAVLISKSDLIGADRILKAVVANTPNNYAHTTESGGDLYMRFWDQNEFLNYANKAKPTQKVFWILSAYPRAYYYLGFLAVAKSRYQDAIPFLDDGLRLEPTNPKFLTEKAHALSKCGRFAEALSTVDGIKGPGPYVSEETFATILRSRGASLIELQRLQAAEAAFLLSLKFAPNNKIALHELDYIKHLHRSGPSPVAGANIQSTVSQSAPVSVCRQCGAANVAGTFGSVDDLKSFVCDRCSSKSVQASAPKKAWQFWK